MSIRYHEMTKSHRKPLVFLFAGLRFYPSQCDLVAGPDYSHGFSFDCQASQLLVAKTTTSSTKSFLPLAKIPCRLRWFPMLFDSRGYQSQIHTIFLLRSVFYLFRPHIVFWSGRCEKYNSGTIYWGGRCSRSIWNGQLLTQVSDSMLKLRYRLQHERSGKLSRYD